MSDHKHIPEDKLARIIFGEGTYVGKLETIKETFNLTPPLPTLADMTPDERQSCVGMWCDNLASTAQEPAPVVLACVQGEQCWILHTSLHGEWSCFSLGSVAPRFDLLQAWNPDGTPVQECDVSKSAPNIDTSTPHADPIDTTPKPGEAWLIEYRGKRYEALFWYSELYAHWTFGMGRKGTFTVESPEATPIARLVPEVKP